MSKEVIVLIGPPGAGKGTQAELLAKRIGGYHLSSGEVLRHQASPHLLEEMNEGELPREQEVNRLLSRSLHDAPPATPLILDGYLRLPEDFAWLSCELQSLGRQLDHIVFLDISEKESAKRTALRGRTDDDDDTLAERWREYQDLTEPLLDDLEQRGLLRRVEGEGTVDDVAARIDEVLA